MHFILAPGAIEKLATLRKAYETERHVQLDSKPSIFGLPTMFGGTDLITRRNQISFLEKIKAVLGRFLLRDEEISSSKEWQAKLMSSRILIAACLYVQKEIASSQERSALYRLINQFLGVTAENHLDTEDKELCYCTAYKLVDQLNVFNHLNNELRLLGKKEFTKDEWTKFSNFISKESQIKETMNAVNSTYPVTTFIQPFFESAFAYVGSTIGSVVAEVVSGSAAAIARRIQLSSLIGGVTLFFVGPAGAAGIALIAPEVATRLISTFCINSFSQITGKTMALVGIGAGAVVGLPVDFAYNAITATGSLFSSTEITFARINGIRLSDGVLMAEGNPMRLNLTLQNQEVLEPIVFDTQDAGPIMLEDKEPPVGVKSDLMGLHG